MNISYKAIYRQTKLLTDISWTIQVVRSCQNLNIKWFGEALRVFVQGFRSSLLNLGFLCYELFVLVHIIFISSYEPGVGHYSMLIYDRLRGVLSFKQATSFWFL